MRVAVVGTGISGLVAARELHRAGHAIDVFEESPRIGGHSNTVHVSTAAGEWAVDTGFIVFNDRNYPNFTRLLGRAWRRHAALDDGILRFRRPGRVRVGSDPAGAVREPRPHRRSVLPSHALGSSALFSRSAGADRSKWLRAVSARVLRAPRVLGLLCRAADRSSGFRASGRPIRSSSGRFRRPSSRSSSPITARCSSWAGRAGTPSSGAHAGMSSRSPPPLRIGYAQAAPFARFAASTTGSRLSSESGGREDVRPRRLGLPLRSGSRDARRSDAAGESGPGRNGLSAQRSRASHRPAGDAAAADRLGELELSPRRRGRRAYHR